MKNKILEFSRNTFASLGVRNFRLYFIGQGISTTGTFMQFIAQAWLVLKLTNNSGSALGMVTALQFAPVLIFGPWGGALADKFPKRKILFITQTFAGLLALTLGILVAKEMIVLWMVYIFALCLGINNAVDNPTRQSFIVEMVGENRLKNAITLNGSLYNLTRVIGPTIAGIVIVAVGLYPCFILNSISFLAVIVVLFLMREDEFEKVPKTSGGKVKFLDGFYYIISNPVGRAILIMIVIIGTFSYEFQVSLPLLAKITFAGNAVSYAALTTAMGVGSVIGGVFIASRRKAQPQALVYAALFFGLAIFLTAIMPNLILTMVAIAIVGMFSIYFTSLANTILQLGSAAEMRGRVMSFWTMAFVGSTTIGGPIVGWIGENFGPRWGLALGGLAAIVAAGIGALVFKNVESSSLEFSPVAVIVESGNTEK